MTSQIINRLASHGGFCFNGQKFSLHTNMGFLQINQNSTEYFASTTRLIHNIVCDAGNQTHEWHSKGEKWIET
jgi:hypothetical protein